MKARNGGIIREASKKEEEYKAQSINAKKDVERLNRKVDGLKLINRAEELANQIYNLLSEGEKIIFSDVIRDQGSGHNDYYKKIIDTYCTEYLSKVLKIKQEFRTYGIFEVGQLPPSDIPITPHQIKDVIVTIHKLANDLAIKLD
jgi:hypothetical protein